MDSYYKFICAWLCIAYLLLPQQQRLLLSMSYSAPEDMLYTAYVIQIITHSTFEPEGYAATQGFWKRIRSGSTIGRVPDAALRSTAVVVVFGSAANFKQYTVSCQWLIGVTSEHTAWLLLAASPLLPAAAAAEEDGLKVSLLLLLLALTWPATRLSC